MTEKNNAMIRTVPAVNELRKVPGFDPLKLLRRTVSAKTGEPVLKLELRYKRLWFRLACPSGRMLLTPLRITDQMAIFEARIYLSKEDSSPVSSFTSTQKAREVPGGLYIRAAQDEALNEALDNAGFGIQLCDLERAGEELYGSEVPLRSKDAPAAEAQAGPEQAAKSDTDTEVLASIPQGGAGDTSEEQAAAAAAEPDEVPGQPDAEPEQVTPEQPAKTEPASSVIVNFPSPAAAEAHADGPEAAAPSAGTDPDTEAEEAAGPAPGFTEDMSLEDICQRMTPEQARGIVVEIGTCRGWALGDVAERRPSSLKFYIYGRSKANNVLKAGAMILLSELSQQKNGGLSVSQILEDLRNQPMAG